MNLAQNGFIDEAVEVITKLHINDPRNQDSIIALALINESINKIPDAIEYRIKIAKLDPWNANNYLQMAFNYKFLGNKVQQQNYLDKVLTFAAADPMVIKAVPELTPQS